MWIWTLNIKIWISKMHIHIITGGKILVSKAGMEKLKLSFNLKVEFPRKCHSFVVVGNINPESLKSFVRAQHRALAVKVLFLNALVSAT